MTAAIAYGLEQADDQTVRVYDLGSHLDRPFLATDAAWYALAVGATAITSYVLAPWFTTFALSSSARALGQLPWAARLAIGVVAFDAVSFAVHVTMHRSDLLWSFHKVHHSTLELDGFATARSHLFENMVGGPSKKFLPMR